MQIYRSSCRKTNKIYLRESGENTLGESTPPNHRRQQLNGLIRSTPELDHQPCTRTSSNFLTTLNPRVRNKFFHDGLIKQKKLNTCNQQSFSPCTPRHSVLFQCSHINIFSQALMPSQSNLQPNPSIPMIQDLALEEFWGLKWAS